MLSTVLFWSLSFGIILSAIAVVRSHRATYAVLSLVVTMCLTAGIFVLLKAYLVAAIQVLVYAGAVLVLFLIIVMLLDLKEVTSNEAGFQPSHLAAGAIGAAFLAPALYIIRHISVSKIEEIHGTAESMGRMLFTRYALPFELTSILLFAAILSVVVLAKRETQS